MIASITSLVMMTNGIHAIHPAPQASSMATRFQADWYKCLRWLCRTTLMAHGICYCNSSCWR
uniref:Uncharacterized protein n=1 Tax=Arundo donax TaxID=35708 RepID=A0A0A8ZQ93_ARUDO